MKKIVALLLLASCSRTPLKIIKKNLVLIQGYHLDETSWNEVKKYIPVNQFNIITLGRLGRESSQPASLANIANVSCGRIHNNSILIAHSFGGAIANAMFGSCPQKISKIIYISAVVPKNDEKPFARMSEKADQENYAKIVTFNKTSITPKAPEIFYPGMDSEIDMKQGHLPKLYSEPMSLMEEAVHYELASFNKLRKSYIMTEKDQVVSLKTQEMFIRDARIKESGGIPTGHFPMITKPEDLTEMILDFVSL
jgi:pimeloyl-ACP methyl ester carboxylesterase